MRRWTFRLDRVAFALAALAVVSCSEDVSEFCTRAPEGEYLVDMSPENFADPFRFTGVLEKVSFFATQPPRARYDFRLANQQLIAVFAPDLGYPLPITPDSTYTLDIVVKGGVPPATGIRVFDAKGLLHVAVTDFNPNQRAFIGGYGTTPDGQELGVRFGEAGCPDISDSDPCLQGLFNRYLVYEMDTSAVGQAGNGETVTAQGWVFHTYKAISVVPSCTDALQNQLSFFIERSDAR